MDFFSEVFCVVSFFLFYIFAHQKHQDEKKSIIKDWKNKHSVIFPARGFKALVLFYFFLFLFLMEQRPVIFTFGKATVRVLLDLQRTNELGC